MKTTGQQVSRHAKRKVILMTSPPATSLLSLRKTPVLMDAFKRLRLRIWLGDHHRRSLFYPTWQDARYLTVISLSDV
jgi:hypothetical protein